MFKVYKNGVATYLENRELGWGGGGFRENIFGEKVGGIHEKLSKTMLY